MKNRKLWKKTQTMIMNMLKMNPNIPSAKFKWKNLIAIKKILSLNTGKIHWQDK